MSKALVIPCYNEALRLPMAEIEHLLTHLPDLKILLVDDGSKDKTAEILNRLAIKHSQIEALILPENRGKAEAVRAGLIHLMENNVGWVGYADADFATPASELIRLYEIAEKVRPELLIGSRVLLLGTNIDRKPKRHYLGRVFATFASMALDLKVYDTQCGAKFFRNSPEVLEALREPFFSRWAFDVELIARLKLIYPLRARTTFIEVPLLEWRDVGGSKLKMSSMIKAGLDLFLIALRLRKQRRLAGIETKAQPT